LATVVLEGLRAVVWAITLKFTFVLFLFSTGVVYIIGDSLVHRLAGVLAGAVVAVFGIWVLWRILVHFFRAFTRAFNALMT